MSRHQRGTNNVPGSGTSRLTMMGTATRIDELRRLLREEYGNDRSSAKALAADADASIETAKAWLKGKRGMSLGYFLEVARKRARLRGWVMERLGIEMLVDPQLEANLLAAARRMAEIKGGMHGR